MNLFLQIPFEIRLLLMLVAGAVVGGQLNRGVYRLAYNRRSIGPWSRPDPKAPLRVWSDYLPIVGWLGLARESKLHGPGYWVRPLLIELACGAGFASLYFWETTGGLLPSFPGLIKPPNVQEIMHWQCLSHLLLISLMVVATFIDFDEQTIPDEVTVPGTLAGLLLAAAVPISILPTVNGPATLGTLLFSPPFTWPDWIEGPWGLAAGLACFWGWCLAIVPSLWTMRRGLFKAIQYQLVSMVRGSGLWRYILLGALGGAGIAAIWWRGGGNWQALISSLLGLAFSGSLIWGVRIVGSAALGKEAMGFGDVTLMAMIGAFLGWQPSLLVFFLAPFAALFIALTQWLITRRHDIAFGPYLCLAALILIVRWNAIWHLWAVRIFDLGLWIPLLVFACLILMGVMLFAWRAIKALLFGSA